LVIVSTNEVIQSCDYTSGLARRRISIPMFNQIKGDRQKNLIEHKNGQMRGEFLPYIPGLLNWVLMMDEEVATETVKNYEESVPSLLAMKAITLVETNPIADWLDNFVVYEQSARTNVGVAKRDKDSNSPCWYLDTDRWLYPNYAEYCHNSGTRPVSLRRFVTLLSDLGKNQLGLEIKKERDRFGSYFVGLKIRSEDDPEPPLITGNTAIEINISPRLENTNVINRLWTMVMDKVTDIIDHMMDESTDGDECDEYDGKNEKSSNNQNKVGCESECNTIIEGIDKKKEISSEFLKMPSYASQKKAQSQAEHDIKDNQSAITVGDRVTVEDCSGHWSWASPFTVQAIEGEMAKLEMVDELIEMSLLEKCC
jgi:putative DNA primase/helicase